MSEQIEKIKNPLLREFAEKTQHMSKGDFGMTVYGGVDLEEYAKLIVEECAQVCWSVSESEYKGFTVSECSKRMRKHFGVKD